MNHAPKPSARRLAARLVRRLGLVPAALGAALAISCSLWPGKAEQAASRPVPAEAIRIAINQREFGRVAYCAVTGQHFVIGSESRSAIYHGRTLYFRDEDALKAFLENPGEYQPDPLESLYPPQAK